MSGLYHSLMFLGKTHTSQTPWETAKVKQKVSEKESPRISFSVVVVV